MINLDEVINNKQIQMYSNKVAKSRIGGSLPKKFVRVHQSVFGDLWDKIEKGEVSYKTYIDDYIKSGQRLEYISCLLKKTRSDSYTSSQTYVDRELSTIALANMLKIPCVYSIPVNYKDQLYTLSIDFVPYNYKVKTLTDFTKDVFLDTYMPLEEFVEEAYPMIFSKSKYIPNYEKYDYTNKQIVCLLEEMFFKKHIIGDADFCSDNMVMIYPKMVAKGNPFVGPIVDQEYAFSNRLAAVRLVEDVQFLYDKYPQVLDKFLNFADKSLKCQYSNIKNELSKVIEDKETVENFTLFIVQNLNRLDVAFRVVIEEKDLYKR